ncbi:MAG: hypothetical protein KGS48_09235 [Bacteroidetes bacterium]|nr:hypothetical protein [Bacteroidota bacterium]
MRLFLMFIFSLPGMLQAQQASAPRRVTMQALLQEMHQCTDTVYILRAAQIIPDVPENRFWTDVQNKRGTWNGPFNRSDTLQIACKVYFENVTIAPNCVWPCLVFKQSVLFEHIETSGNWRLQSCRFENGLTLNQVKAGNLIFDHCELASWLLGTQIDVHDFTCNESDFEGDFRLSNQSSGLNFSTQNCNFTIHSLMLNALKGGSIRMENSFVQGLDSTAFIHLGGVGYFDYLTLERDTFLCNLLITDCSVKERLNVFKCRFAEKVAMQGFDVPEKNTDARWYQFDQGHLAIATEGKMVFSGTTALSAESEDDFYSLIKVYYQLLRAYKYTGDEESYDACFIEMKDLITRKSRWNWNQSHRMNDFAEWQLNRFLRLFCDYGVNPGKALFMSLIIIALFGFIYLLFPLEPLPFNWSDLFYGLTVGKLSFAQRILLIGIALRCWLNACGYSMNAFVTLGYGHGRGFARYIAVAEGLLGWFMFSIFSASLIGQILSQG